MTVIGLPGSSRVSVYWSPLEYDALSGTLLTVQFLLHRTEAFFFDTEGQNSPSLSLKWPLSGSLSQVLESDRYGRMEKLTPMEDSGTMSMMSVT